MFSYSGLQNGFRGLRSIMMYIRKHLFVKLLAILLVLLLIFKITQPYFFSYATSYAKVIVDLVNSDMQRHKDVMRQQAELVWGYHQMQKRFMQDICKEKKLPPKRFCWLVSLSSDNVLPGAIATGHAIKRLSCYNKIGAMVTSTVSSKTKMILKQVGFEIFEVESLDCNWMEKSRNVKQTNTGIPGTHTRFQAWTLTQFERIIYVDIDFMLLSNIDELFDSPGDLSAVYCARPGVLDPCFNAGLAVFRPSMKTRAELMSKWKELTSVMGCVSDQVVMWYYFAFSGRWNPLPYSYNVRRKLYYPMKAYHFAGYGVTAKPWDIKNPPTKKEAFDFPGPGVDLDLKQIRVKSVFKKKKTNYFPLEYFFSM